jgi:formylmethanofuran dehydrogenase subunit D
LFARLARIARFVLARFKLARFKLALAIAVKMPIMSQGAATKRASQRVSLPWFFFVRTWFGCIMPETFILIPGRTSRQGTGISEGKFGENYQNETSVLQVTPADMQRLGLNEGDRVRLTSETGAVDVAIKPSKGDELPPGLLFIPYGDVSSRLMAGDTHGSGMPTSKGIDVTLEKIV